MLTEELNLILVGADWHELPYRHRHKADVRVTPDIDLGYLIHILALGVSVWELRDVQDALRCCHAYRAPGLPKILRGRRCLT